MLYRITVSVQGGAWVKTSYPLNILDYHLQVNADDEGRVTEMSIETRVCDYQTVIPTLQPGAGTEEQPCTIRTPANPYHEDLIALTQYIESIGSFWFQIGEINWSEPKVEWVPESEEEEQALSVISLHRYSKGYPDNPVEMHPSHLAHVIARRRELEYLTIPMAFFRQGQNDHRAFRYISAFYNYYFFIESLYGHGKSKNYHVKRAFRKSPQLRRAMARSLQVMESPESMRHAHTLREQFDEEHCPWTTEGAIDFLVSMRGKLHHFSLESTKTKGHPLNEERFEALAYFIYRTCLQLLVGLISVEK